MQLNCNVLKLRTWQASLRHTSQRHCVPRHSTIRRYQQRAPKAVAQTEASELSSDKAKLFVDLSNAYDLYRRAPPSEVNTPVSQFPLAMYPSDRLLGSFRRSETLIDLLNYMGFPFSRNDMAIIRTPFLNITNRVLHVL